ncbi:MFS transporter [Clostridium luticellarii]|jgi:predicted MFS family arabinose efflux permease|uniref:MFS transporter n=1 Tax=Clostridium luticellarii TaxID=1691940 RepID=UPI0023563995|nr:MFS transporter [Clostridium luticellarii]MCI1944137.1 MFS transporter [Clostridium luticellarii]MCI1967639.1 MFS transporter [Clostridium luticellarii]
MNQNTNMAIPKEFEISRFLIILMSIASGATAANLYYSQPLLEKLSRYFNVSSAMIGITAMMIQIGYALGLVFLVPLGDIKERRSLIMTMLFCSALALLGLSFASNTWWLSVSSLLVGLTSVTPMLIVALAAHLAKPAKLGQVIGNVMSGLLIGILLSRVFSGIIGSILGWQAVYRIAAAMMVLLIIAFSLFFPKSSSSTAMSYRKLLESLADLLRTQPVLQEASLIGAMMFATFSAFWTTLSFLLKLPVYNLGTQAAGMFGLVGIIGALAASVVGRIADKKSPRFTLSIAIVISALSYVCFLLFGYQMWGLIIGVVLLDLGIQSGQISNQARINALDAAARNRNNAVYMTFYFCGGALGSFLGTFFWGFWGWTGVCVVGIIFQIVAAAIHFSGIKHRSSDS